MDPTATMLAEVKQGEIPLRREWSVDAVVGYVFSLSCCSPATFGEERAAFEVALRERLVELGGGPFTQETVVEIISGRVDGP